MLCTTYYVLPLLQLCVASCSSQSSATCNSCNSSSSSSTQLLPMLAVCRFMVFILVSFLVADFPAQQQQRQLMLHIINLPMLINALFYAMQLRHEANTRGCSVIPLPSFVLCISIITFFSRDLCTSFFLSILN